ncbi:MAG TPA: PhzF family phenazine biosynthesis isomerase [Bacteroidota bacterium]|nr:PhzF family phenazine biosynthesis isomerase [Bacteroidota bacterium]
MNIRLKHIDAFTDTPLAGNPAGVVLNADGLTDQQMQRIAFEVRASETAFILPPETPDAHVRVRWFTPSVEVPLCGHATIASFHALAEEKMLGMSGPGNYAFRLESKSGVLGVQVEKNADGISVILELPLPEFSRAGHHKLDVMRILNIQIEDFDNHIPIVEAGNLYVPIRRLHTIFAMKPNFLAMTQFLANRGIEGLCVFTTETVDRTSSFHSRFFAPTVGIVEDPVTGSANGPLGAYLFERGLIQEVGPVIMLTGEQGDPIGRKGRVTVRLNVDNDRVTAVAIGGRAVTVLEGEMRVT